MVRTGAALLGALFLVGTMATFVWAQSDTELEATIRTAILSDPRSSQMSEAEIDAMVAVLAEGAKAEGITSEDILWRPQEIASETESSEACGYAAFLCALNDAFGLTGSAVLIPLLLGITSALLLFVIGSILLHSHGRHPFVGSLRTEE